MFIRNSQILAIQKSSKIKTGEFTMCEKCCNKCGSKELYIKEKEIEQDCIAQIVEYGLNGFQKMRKEYL